jgi:ribosomal protein L35AE/L33A
MLINEFGICCEPTRRVARFGCTNCYVKKAVGKQIKGKVFGARGRIGDALGQVFNNG